MNRRIFTTLRYMSIFIVLLICCVLFEILAIMASISVFTIPREDQMLACIFMNILGVSGIIAFICYLINSLQWVNIDENGINARNLIKTIHYREWNQIKEIREVWLPMSGQIESLKHLMREGMKLKYFILIDERENIVLNNIVMRKNSYIMIPRNKKTEQIIKEFYKKEIVKLEEKS